MQLYENIKKRRVRLGLSQDELAQLTGYKDRTSISKIEAGKVDLSQRRVAMFAKALQTTPAALLGIDAWEDAALHAITVLNIDSPREQKLARSIASYCIQHMQKEYYSGEYSNSELERALVRAFNKLNQLGQQNAVLRVEEMTEIEKYIDTPSKEACAHDRPNK